MSVQRLFFALWPDEPVRARLHAAARVPPLRFALEPPGRPRSGAAKSPEAAQLLPELFPGNDLAALSLGDGGKQRLLFLR